MNKCETLREAVVRCGFEAQRGPLNETPGAVARSSGSASLQPVCRLRGGLSDPLDLGAFRPIAALEGPVGERFGLSGPVPAAHQAVYVEDARVVTAKEPAWSISQSSG